MAAALVASSPLWQGESTQDAPGHLEQKPSRSKEANTLRRALTIKLRKVVTVPSTTVEKYNPPLSQETRTRPGSRSAPSVTKKSQREAGSCSNYEMGPVGPSEDNVDMPEGLNLNRRQSTPLFLTSAQLLVYGALGEPKTLDELVNAFEDTLYYRDTLHRRYPDLTADELQPLVAMYMPLLCELKEKVQFAMGTRVGMDVSTAKYIDSLLSHVDKVSLKPGNHRAGEGDARQSRRNLRRHISVGSERETKKTISSERMFTVKGVSGQWKLLPWRIMDKGD
eukprot:comp23713_c0_seq1/m.40797 comp23713_c0_seq1/g.40797  ORF comp23713_c0_seq1/g.40797 comp23713_c0_seq1/m.40797 type:complete len:280 (-) comp23713_c0_seq1:2811-3650(-)